MPQTDQHELIQQIAEIGKFATSLAEASESLHVFASLLAKANERIKDSLETTTWVQISGEVLDMPPAMSETPAQEG